MNIIKLIKSSLWLTAIFTALSSQAQPSVYSLQDYRRLALEHNKKIKAAQSQVQASQAAWEGAKLNNRPSLDGSVMGIYVGKPLDKLLPPVIGSASLSATQPIYAGGKIRLGVQAAEKGVRIAEGQKAIAEADLMLAVETAYWQLSQARARVQLTEKYRQMLQGLRDELKNAVDAGLTYKNDQLRADVSLNEADLNYARAGDALVLTRLNLAQLTGLPDTDLSVPDSVTVELLLPPHLDTTYADNRPEVQVLKDLIEVQQIQAGMIRADAKPQIGLSAGAFGSAGKGVNFTNNNNLLGSYFGVVNLSVPIVDWGRNHKKVTEQQMKVQASRWELDDTRERIGIEMQAALLQVRESEKKIKLSGLSLSQAEENLRLATDRFKAGTITGKDVLEAQAVWQQAYANTIDARAELRINTASYKKAIGELK